MLKIQLVEVGGAGGSPTTGGPKFPRATTPPRRFAITVFSIGTWYSYATLLSTAGVPVLVEYSTVTCTL